MSETPKRRRGDRRDAALLRETDALHFIMGIIYPHRADNEAYIAERVNLEPIKAYLAKKNVEGIEFKYTFFHVIVAALVKTITLRPKLNRFYANENYYQRNKVTAGFIIKKEFSDGSEEAVALLDAAPTDTMDTVHEEIRRRVDDALTAVGMEKFTRHAPHLLSGGQKQRVAIAGVLAMQPEILVMDEPTAMLDPSGRQEVLRTIADLRAATGVTVVLITHHMDECIDADRLLVVSDGKLVLDGAPKDVFSRVEQMRSIGLDVPATTETLYELRAAGADVPLGALSDAEAADAIVRWLGN